MESKPFTVEEWENLEAHPAAEAFPLMEGVDFEELVASIRDRGFHPDKPIILYDGKILDGRNRHNACRELERRGGLKEPPLFREWEPDGSPVDWVVDTNLCRRHLTASQKAAVAAELAPLYAQEARERMLAGKKVEEDPGTDLCEGSAKGKAAAAAAKATGASQSYVEQAAKIRRGDPELFDRVKQGEVTISAARQELPKEDSAPKRLALPREKAEQLFGKQGKKARGPAAEARSYARHARLTWDEDMRWRITHELIRDLDPDVSDLGDRLLAPIFSRFTPAQRRELAEYLHETILQLQSQAEEGADRSE